MSFSNLLFFFGIECVFLIVLLFIIKSKFWRRVLLIADFTLCLTAAASLVSSTKFFSIYVYPENLALEDFDITDYAIANLRPTPKFDDRLVLVNFGNLSRREIAKLLNAINQYRPRVVGIDALFNCIDGKRDTANCPQLLDTLGNEMLIEAFKNTKNTILGSKLLQSTKMIESDDLWADSLELSDPLFQDVTKHGYVTIPSNAKSQEEIKICRTIFPKYVMNGQVELDFSVQIAMLYDSVKTKKFIYRNYTEEIINFRRNINLNHKNSKYRVLDFQEILNPTSDSSKLSQALFNKIVIMGYMGEEYGDGGILDEFYTPLNPISAGRSLPDMFGIVLRANVISMILDEDWIMQLNQFQEFLIAFISAVFHVALLVLLSRIFPNWFELLSIMLIILQLFIYSWLRINLFILYNIKVNFYLTLGSLALATISVNLCREIYKLSYPKLPSWIQSRL